MRLDIYLLENNYCETRSKASQLIKNNKVLVNDKVITKNGFEVKENDAVKVLQNDVLKYVSRGGLKLEKAISYFSLDFKDKVICDIGSSTGGFTDCSLHNGAKKVYAIDVGSNQLHESLRNRSDVIVFENTNFKDVTTNIFTDKIDYFVCDVSFISIRQIINKLISLYIDFTLICLFKPQFEVGPSKLNHNGVVKTNDDILNTLNDFEIYLRNKNINILNCTYSPILGNKQGNKEFLFYLSTSGTSIKFNYEEIISLAMDYFNER